MRSQADAARGLTTGAVAGAAVAVIAAGIAGGRAASAFYMVGTIEEALEKAKTMSE